MKLYKRVNAAFNRLIKACTSYRSYKKSYGSRAAYHICRVIFRPGKKNKAYISAIYDCVLERLLPLVDKYKDAAVTESESEKQKRLEERRVWVMWLQGETEMPELVKVCYNRLKKLTDIGYNVHLINQDNLCDYAELPDYIEKKHKLGKITNAFYSDMVRLALLNKYGGVWIDSTVFLTKPISDSFFTHTFYSQRFTSSDDCPGEPCEGKWCFFYQGGCKNNPLFAFASEALVYWSKTYDTIPDYILADYVYLVAYNNIPSVRAQLDGVAPNNENMWLLARHLNDEYNEKAYKHVMSSAEFFKLSHGAVLADSDSTVYAQMKKDSII